jgi:N-acetylglucosamine-6-phosphate deacetylase
MAENVRVLSAGTVLAVDRDLQPGYVVVSGGTITRVAGGAPPHDAGPLLPFPDGTLIPGLIDLQVNGGAGVDCSRCTPEGYDVLGRYLAATGVTAYLPTVVSAPLDEMRRAAAVAGEAMARRRPLPSILGVHMEGPYLNPLRRGAHRAQDLRHPSVDEVTETLRRARGTLRVMTLAPELEGAQAVISRLAGDGVVVALGHTDAGFDDIRAAAGWGAKMVTHVFNAMRGIHHREPGAAGGALLIPALTVGVIADLVHVHPAVLKLIARVAGLSRIALVTDAMAAAGMGRGSFTLGPQTVDVKDGGPRLSDGSLAGSVLQMFRAVRNFADAAGVPLRDAVQPASLVPARLLGIARKGRIARDCDADLVALDRDGGVVLTMVGGEIAYQRAAERT